MRKYLKGQCTELIRTLDEAHGEIEKCLNKKDINGAAELLTGCQQGAITIGGIIEESEGEGTIAVSKLETYCELAYGIYEDLIQGKDINPHQTVKRLQKFIREAQSGINILPTKIEAVFFPYKASMWDSLESVWMAADKDTDCDAYVVPIPYYDRGRDGSFVKEHYEKDLYPDYVKVTDYREYDISIRHPDIVYIHNPYDENNNVTSVYPDYYSYNLKKYTDCLVYIPYYATAGNMAEGQALLLSYFHVDYIIVQSESMMGFFDPMVPRNKLLPLGSPKFDKIIHACQNPPVPPADWAEKMKGRKVFFFNTSIAGFLGDTDRFLKKMKYVFDTFKDREDVCLLWRPHPLLESTVDSMRPEARPAYEALKSYFIEQRIGIFDETPDIENTIALCDAYLGDAGTSVTSLFGVVGKPLYLLNNHLLHAPTEDDWQAWVAQSLRHDRNNRYCITMGNRLFEDRDGDYHYRYLCNLSDEFAGGGYYSRALEVGDKIVVFPNNAENILILDKNNPQSKRKIALKHEGDRGGAFAWFFNFFLEESHIYWILPNRYPALVKFDTRTEEVFYIKDEAFTEDYAVHIDAQQRRIIAARWTFGTKWLLYGDGEPEVIDCPEEDITIPGIRMKGKRLFCLNKEGTRLRAISLDTGETEERALSWNGLYVGMMRDIYNMDVMWFLPYEGTALGKWTLSDDKWETVDVRIDGIKSIWRPQGFECNIFYFSNAIFVNGKMILAPNWGNKFVEVDVETNEAKEWIPPFSYTLEDKNDYWFNGSIGSFYVDPWTLERFFFYAPEHKTYRLDFDNNTYSEIPITFDKDEILSMAPGFHKDSQWMPYCCFEDVFNSLENIASGNIKGPAFEKERQIEAYCTVNASPNEDCGEKVFAACKRMICSSR